MFKPESEEFSAEKIFTDREEPREAYRKMKETLCDNRGSICVLNYYGLGGIGKTRLLIELKKETTDLSFILFDFGLYQSIDKLFFVRTLAQMLFNLDHDRFSFWMLRAALKTYAGKTATDT